MAMHGPEAAFPFQAVDISVSILFGGLASIAHCKSTGKNKRKSLLLAKRNASALERIAKINPGYGLSMLSFLRAEIGALEGKPEVAEAQYLSAIALLGRSKELYLHAIASERAGRFMLECGNKDAAKAYLLESLDFFSQWGAKGKARSLRKEVGDTFGQESMAISPNGIHQDTGDLTMQT